MVVNAFALLLAAAHARASALVLGAVTCLDGSCGSGIPAASGGDVIPGATSIGVGISSHFTEPEAMFDAFLGVFSAPVLLSTSLAKPTARRPAKAMAPALRQQIPQQWTITGGTGTGHLALSEASAAAAVNPRR